MHFDHFLMGAEEGLRPFSEWHQLADRLSILGDNNLFASRLDFIHELQAFSLELGCFDGFLWHDDISNSDHGHDYSHIVVGGQSDRRVANWAIGAMWYRASGPMPGSAASLNVSVAAGVCLFEAVRQRGANTAWRLRAELLVILRASWPRLASAGALA